MSNIELKIDAIKKAYNLSYKYFEEILKKYNVEVSEDCIIKLYMQFFSRIVLIDDNLQNEEISLLKRFLGLKGTNETIKNIVQSIYNKKIAIPTIIEVVVLLDKDKSYQGKESPSQAVLMVLKYIGYELIGLKCNDSLSIQNEFRAYVENIGKYIDKSIKEKISEEDVKEKIYDILTRFDRFQREYEIEHDQEDIAIDEDFVESDNFYNNDSTKKNRKTKSKNDVEKKKDIKDKEKTLEESLKELDGYIGLNRVKNEINTLVKLIKVRKKREETGLKNPDMSYHLCFLGNPGTGKTTVARILANIYRALGILEKGQLIEVGRQDLVGGYVGQTAIKTKDVIKKAYGGILFIDEAYSLTNKGSENDYGTEAIEILLKEMEDHRNELVVIVAGYENLMKDFVRSNPGLESRFNTYINFEDYEPKELLEIIKMQCKKNDYKLADGCEDTIIKIMGKACCNKKEDFANARFARNVFENAIKKQSYRLVEEEDITKEKLQTLEAIDFE